MNKKALMQRLAVLDFISVDLQLYLDNYPDDEEAVEKYNAVIKEADMLRVQYEKTIGPLYSFRSYNQGNEFNWVNDPWPWDREANFEISDREDCK